MKAKVVEVPLEAFARLMTGLQSPRSLDTLGTAKQPFDELRQHFGIFGWADVDEHIDTITARPPSPKASKKKGGKR